MAGANCLQHLLKSPHQAYDWVAVRTTAALGTESVETCPRVSKMQSEATENTRREKIPTRSISFNSV